MLHREQGRRGPAGHADLGVDVLHVVLGRPPGDHQALGDLGVAAPVRDQPQHLHLAGAQPRRQRPAGDHGAVARRGQHGADGVGVEGPLPGVGEQPLLRLLGRERRPLWPALGHRLVGVGGRQHPGRHGQVAAPTAAVVATSVQPLVVHPDRGGQRRQPFRPGQDPLGVVGVQPDLLPLVGVQAARLLPHHVRDGHPADVVQQPGHLEVGKGGRGEPESFPGPAGEGGHAARMPVGQGRLQIGQVGEDGRHLDQPVLRHRHHRRGLRLQHQGSRVGRVDLAQQRLGVVREPPGHRRVQHGAAAPPDRVDGQVDPADGVEQHRDPGQPGHPRPGREVVAGQPGRVAAALPLLVDVVDAALHRLRQPQAPGRVTADLAGRRGVGRPEVVAPGERGERQPGPFQRRPPPSEQRQEGGERVPRVRGVAPPGGHVQDELVTEQPGGLVRIAGASDVVQQRGVEGRPDVVVRQLERPGEPGGERARPQRLARLEPESQVGEARQPRQQVRQPHRHRPPRPRRRVRPPGRPRRLGRLGRPGGGRRATPRRVAPSGRSERPRPPRRPPTGPACPGAPTGTRCRAATG